MEQLWSRADANGGDRARIRQARERLKQAETVALTFGGASLAHNLHVSGSKALELGLCPFVPGDLIKLDLAAPPYGVIASVAAREGARELARRRLQLLLNQPA